MNTVVDMTEWKNKHNIDKTDKAVLSDMGQEHHNNMIVLAADFIMSEWTKAAGKGELNQYFVESLGLGAGEYIDDLNLLAMIEKDRKINLAIFHPGTTPIQGDTDGYSVIIRVHDNAVATPLMINECYARAFMILFHNELIASGVI